MKNETKKSPTSTKTTKQSKQQTTKVNSTEQLRPIYKSSEMQPDPNDCPLLMLQPDLVDDSNSQPLSESRKQIPPKHISRIAFDMILPHERPPPTMDTLAAMAASIMQASFELTKDSQKIDRQRQQEGRLRKSKSDCTMMMTTCPIQIGGKSGKNENETNKTRDLGRVKSQPLVIKRSNIKLTSIKRKPSTAKLIKN